MTRLYNTLIGIVMMQVQMASLIQCSWDSGTPYFPVYYPEIGKQLTVDVSVSPQDHTWRKDDKPLNISTCLKVNDPKCPRTQSHPYLIRGRLDLNFNKIRHEDSGKYILEVSCPKKRLIVSFEILVQDSPFVVSDCKDMTVKEGENITCVCKTTSGHPSAEVTWSRNKPHQENLGLRNSTGILRLENISKNDSGTYVCTPSTQNSPNTTSFNLKVVSKNYISAKNKVKIEQFQAFGRDVDGYCQLIIVCKAKGIPEPRYMITHNGSTVEYGNVFKIDTRKNTSRGNYECLARNRHGSDKRSLFLNENFFARACDDSGNVICNNEVKWKHRIIVGASSFFAGILVLCVLTCCRKNSRKESKSDENCEGNYDDVLPKPVNESSEYVEESSEMRLRHTSEGPGTERQSVPNVLVCCCKKSNKDEDYDGEYDDVSPRGPTDSARGPTDSAAEIFEMRLRHTSKSPGAEEQRDSAEYDIPESGNRHESEYCYDNNYTKFVAFRNNEDKKYEN